MNRYIEINGTVLNGNRIDGVSKVLKSKFDSYDEPFYITVYVSGAKVHFGFKTETDARHARHSVTMAAGLIN